MESAPPFTVLVVDDTDAIARRVSDLLNELPGVGVVGRASDVPEALRMFHGLAPRAVVLDLGLQGEGGLAVLREIRASQKECFVVVLTNQVEASIRERCLAGGADAFLDKAVDFERAVELIRERCVVASHASVGNVPTASEESTE